MDKDYQLKALSTLLEAEAWDEIGFKLFILKKIVLENEPGCFMNREELIIQMEDYPSFLSEKRMFELLESTGYFTQVETGYCLEPETLISRLCRISDSLDHPIIRDDLKNILSDKETGGWSIRQVKAALARGLDWIFTITEIAGNEPDFSGLPAYWECGLEGDQPLGILQAGTCNADALCAVAESLWSPVAMTDVDYRDKIGLLDKLLTYNLDCQLPRAGKEWAKMSATIKKVNHGGSFAHEDQPGAFHPTVDSTSDLVLSLSIFYYFYDRIANETGTFETPKDQIGQSIIDGLEFLLRMQLDNGGWGIYKYPEAQVAAHQNPSYLTICAFGLAKMCGALDKAGRDDLYPAVNSAIGRYVDFIMDHRIEENGITLWAPGFAETFENFNDALETSTKVYRSLFSIVKGMEAFRPEVYPRLEKFIGFIDKHWTPDYKKLARYPFRVPLENELSDTFNYWEIRQDILLSINLLDWYNGQFAFEGFRAKLSEKIWDQIEITVGNILKEQHPEHGHWNDPDNDRPFVVSTLYAMEVLTGYLIAVHNMTES